MQSYKYLNDSTMLTTESLKHNLIKKNKIESISHKNKTLSFSQSKNDKQSLFIDTLSPNDIAPSIDITFLDPPYNSRQYSRFYHLLETLTLNTKPKLYGIAKKPEVNNMSEYCKVGAKEALKDLLDSLKTYTRYIVMTYNNTRSANARSNTRISLNDIQSLLEAIGTTHIHEYNFKAFNSGKTDTKTSFKEHKEYVFVCEVKTK